jgi:hypothetical protein
VPSECGNKQCEDGESCTDAACGSGCRADCPAVLHRCPTSNATSPTRAQLTCAGQGACVTATGTCKCRTGYRGSDCSACAEDYTRDRRRGLCVFLPGGVSSCSDGAQSSQEEGIDCGGVCPRKCAAIGATNDGSLTTLATKLKQPLIVGIVAAVAAVVVAAVVAAVVVRKIRRRRTAVVDERTTSAAGRPRPRVIPITPTNVRDWEESPTGKSPSPSPSPERGAQKSREGGGRAAVATPSATTSRSAAGGGVQSPSRGVPQSTPPRTVAPPPSTTPKARGVVQVRERQPGADGGSVRDGLRVTSSSSVECDVAAPLFPGRGGGGGGGDGGGLGASFRKSAAVAPAAATPRAAQPPLSPTREQQRQHDRDARHAAAAAAAASSLKDGDGTRSARVAGIADGGGGGAAARAASGRGFAPSGETPSRAVATSRTPARTQRLKSNIAFL